MWCVYKHRVCQQRLGGTLAKAKQHCSLELCVCSYQEAERIHFGLVVFAEGRSGLVPKTWRSSQPDLGKYAIHTINTHTHTQPGMRRHTESNKKCIWCKQTNMNPAFLTLSLFVLPSHTHSYTNTRFPTENHHLSWLRNRFPIHLSVHFNREMAMCMKEAWIKADLREADSGLICRHSAVLRGSNALTPIDCRRAEGEHFKC